MMAYTPYFKRITAYRLDNIVTVKIGEIADRFDELRDKLSEMQQHMWGSCYRQSIWKSDGTY